MKRLLHAELDKDPADIIAGSVVAHKVSLRNGFHVMDQYAVTEEGNLGQPETTELGLAFCAKKCEAVDDSVGFSYLPQGMGETGVCQCKNQLIPVPGTLHFTSLH